jgi:DNA glycosylase AlkZ-like
MTSKSTALPVLTWDGVTARRMARHALAEPATDLGPAGITGVLCGAHAQMLSAAELSIGRRIAGATRADVQRARWQERTLVKTFGPRGTIHLLPTADLPMWTGALSALPPSVPTHPEGVRFTGEQADEVIAAMGAALADTELTVDELTEAIADRCGLWTVERTMEAFGGKWPRWRQLTSTAAHRGMLCFGPDRELPGPARRRRGRRGVAPATLRPQARHHRRTTAQADRIATTAALRRGRPGGCGDGGDGDADRGHRDRRPARLSEPAWNWSGSPPMVSDLAAAEDLAGRPAPAVRGGGLVTRL